MFDRGSALSAECGNHSAQEPAARLRIEVRSEAGPVRDADVVINGTTQKTDAQGVTAFTIPPGHVDIVVVKSGFAAASASLDLAASQQQTIVVEPEPHRIRRGTRDGIGDAHRRGIEDQPMRVEVVDREEIDEKVMMTPGDVVMLLNETGGMRVQATSPSLGAASVRFRGCGVATRGSCPTACRSSASRWVAGSVADSTDGPGPRGGYQRCRVIVIWRRRDERRRQSGAERPASTARTQGPAELHRREARPMRGLWVSDTPLANNWGLTLLGSANGQAQGRR